MRFRLRRCPRPETNTRPKQPNSRPDTRVALSEGGAGGYLATYLAVVARAIDLGLSVRLSDVDCTCEKSPTPTHRAIDPHHSGDLSRREARNPLPRAPAEARSDASSRHSTRSIGEARALTDEVLAVKPDRGRAQRAASRWGEMSHACLGQAARARYRPCGRRGAAPSRGGCGPLPACGLRGLTPCSRGHGRSRRFI